MTVLIAGATVVNVTGAEAATPNGTPPSFTRVPAENGYVLATVPVSTGCPRRARGWRRSGAIASQPARCSQRNMRTSAPRSFTRWHRRFRPPLERGPVLTTYHQRDRHAHRQCPTPLVGHPQPRYLLEGHLAAWRGCTRLWSRLPQTEAIAAQAATGARQASAAAPCSRSP